MAKRTIGKCRFYADIGSYLKLKAFYESDKEGLESDNVDSVWNLAPVALQSFEIVPNTRNFKFWFKIKLIKIFQKSLGAKKSTY